MQTLTMNRNEPARRLLSFSLLAILMAASLLSGGCAMVGPDFRTPEAPLAQEWLDAEGPEIEAAPAEVGKWWTVFGDPTLDSLIEEALDQNLPLQIAALRILEARAELGIISANRYPQMQQMQAGMQSVNLSDNAANSMAADPSYNDYSIGFDAAWELDFWGRFRRATEAADASLLASIADYDDVLVTLTAEVARNYVLIRTLEERIELALENARIQERSLEIAEVQFAGGVVTELDVQQARSLLRDTQSLIPRLQIDLAKSSHALSILLGTPPADVEDLLGAAGSIPTAPFEVAVGIPADLLRRRPDIRRAELQTAAQSALVGVARSDLFPHFSLLGSIGLRSSNASFTKAGGIGGSDFSDLFSSDSIELFTGPSLRWDIFNYGRLKNRVRVQDARLQQTVVNYRNTVLKAAGEVEDAMTGFLRTQEVENLLGKSVSASKRSVDLSLLQYREGLIDYQRVLDAERFLTQQQDQLTSVSGSVALNLISLYKALGGGWEIRNGRELVSEENREQMGARTDWGEYLEPVQAKEPQAEQ